MRFKLLLLILLLFSCNKSGQPENSSAIDSTGEKTKNIELVSDSARWLLNELNLCDQLILPKHCYEAEHSKFIPLLPDSTYNCFLFEAEGGSGGDDVRVYTKISGEYQMVNDFFGFYDTLPGTMTNGQYDLILLFRDYDRGMVRTLFKWNGKKYIQTEILSINNIPTDLLIALGITDKKKFATKFPYVGETAEYKAEIYGTIYIDTLSSGNNRLDLEVKTSDNPNYGYDKIWKVKYENGKYSCEEVK